MRLRWVVLGVILLSVGCRAKRLADHAATTGPLPANTVMLSQVMQELSSRPEFTEAFLRAVQGGGHKKAGAALLTPALIDALRRRIVGGDWQGLDRFPGWTMREINPTVRVVGHVAGNDAAVESSATAGGAPSGQAAGAGMSRALGLVDVGAFKPDVGGMVDLSDLSEAAPGPGFVTAEYVSTLGDGVDRGDGPNAERAGRHAASAELASALNRLSLNGEAGVLPFKARVLPFTARGADARKATGALDATTPEGLMEALVRSGHTVEVVDSRYFANFGHLHYKGQDVMMPFWVNAQIEVPGTKRGWFGRARPLLVPVSHAEYEWFVRGPEVNAEVSFYFGIDGKAEWRTMDQLDQAWVMNRHAHSYTGAEAMEVTRLSGAMVRTYLHLHQAHPEMPFGGYYAFGVCQDVVAAIELKLTGKTTLFPNTADANFFTNAADREINGLIRGIPKDRDGKPPEVERVFGSLPVGDADAELARVSVPGLGADLVATHDAWTAGTLERVRPRWTKWIEVFGAALLGVGLLTACAGWFRRRPGRRR